jgi:hypothetical protein
MSGLATVTALVTGFSFDDGPAVNSQDELTVARFRGGVKIMAAKAVTACLESERGDK